MKQKIEIQENNLDKMTSAVINRLPFSKRLKLGGITNRINKSNKHDK